MPKQRRRDDVHEVLAGRSAHVVGEQVEQRAGDARDRLADDEREEHEERDRSERSPHELAAAPGALSARVPSADDDRPGHDAPRRTIRTPGTTKKRSPIADADLVDERAEEERSPRHGARGTRVVTGSSAPCRSLATIFSEAAASSSATSSSNTSTITTLTDDVAGLEVVGVDVDAVRDAGELEDRERQPEERGDHGEVPEVETPEPHRVAEHGRECDGRTVQRRADGGDDTANANPTRPTRIAKLTLDGARVASYVAHSSPALPPVAGARARPGRKVASVAHRPLVRHGRIRYVRVHRRVRARARPSGARRRPRRRRARRRPRRRPARRVRSRRRSRGRPGRLARRRRRGAHRGARSPARRGRRPASRCCRAGVAARARPRCRRPRAAPRSRSRSAHGSSPVARRLRHGARAGRAARWSRSPTSSIVVLRGCYLALRRAVHAPPLEHTAGVVLLDEPGRSLRRRARSARCSICRCSPGSR